jgi:hypothetical protein
VDLYVGGLGVLLLGYKIDDEIFLDDDVAIE